MPEQMTRTDCPVSSMMTRGALVGVGIDPNLVPGCTLTDDPGPTFEL